MRLKRLTALGIAAIMSVTALTACGNTDVKTGSSEGSVSKESVASSEKESVASSETVEEGIVFPLKEKMTFTGFTSMNKEFALDETNIAWKTALERANIDIELTNVLNADLVEKRNLLVSSGNYPDVFIRSGLDANATVTNYGDILIPLEDLIKEYAPNLTAWLDEVDGWKYITAADGHIYSLPAANEKNPEQNPIWINKKWMDNLGLEMPTSYEELYDVLKAFKEKDANGNGDPNDEIPISFSTTTSPMRLLSYADYKFSWGDYLGVDENEELFYVPMDESFKEVLALCAKMFDEGIIDKNSFVQDNAQMAAVGQAGDVLGAFSRAGGFQAVGKEQDENYMILTPFSEGTFAISTPLTANAMSITDKCENPEVLVAWADYFYTEEGGALVWMGVEGKTYKVNADGTWEWILSEEYGADVSTLRAKSTISGTQKTPYIQPDFWRSGMSTNVDPDEVYLNKERSRVYEMGVVPMPVLSYTEEESETRGTIKADVTAYIDQYVAQVVTGELDLDASWEDYLKTLKDMRVEELIKIYQDAYARATK